MNQIILATNNQGKVKEFNDLFATQSVNFIPQSAFSLESVAETGQTFIENAIIKARYAAALTNMPALADDSGLEIDALNGAPGVHTARYAGEPGNFEKNIKKVLAEMEGIEQKKRTARVHCVLAFMRHENDSTPLICHGVWEGLISEQPVGDKGFGFDSIFYVPEFGCTAGEMDVPLKNKISHRAKAVEELMQKFSSIFVEDVLEF